MKIILFGGSFDPIHKGHIESAKAAFKKIKADRLYFIPTFLSPVEKQFRANYKNRVEMIKLSISNCKNFFVSQVEKNIEGKSYTWKTLDYFKKIFPDAEFYLLVGSDQYKNINKWNNIEFIRDNSTIICANRQSNLIKKNKNDILLEDFDVDVSSTKLINKIDELMINPKVLNYINDNGLYWKERLNDWKLTDYRIGHSLAVANLAKKIAIKILPKYADDLWIAGIYHDIAKDLSKEDTESFVKKNIPERSYNYPSWKVLHPYIGRYILENYYCFKNKKILSSIENHTIMENFTKFNKILFCADKLVHRPDDNKERRKMINQIIKIAYSDINKAYDMVKKYISTKS